MHTYIDGHRDVSICMHTRVYRYLGFDKVCNVCGSCIQMARAFGSSRVIAVDVNEKKLERMRELGATHTVNASTEDVVERIKVWIYSYSWV